MPSYHERLVGERVLAEMESERRMADAFLRQEHITDGGKCWCNPKVETFEDGTTLTVHNE